MNPQYMNQQPPGQYGQTLPQPGPPPGQYGPPQGQPMPPNSTYNGPNQPMRPQGAYGPGPGKGAMPPGQGMGPPRPGQQNGPQPGPQGDQYAMRPPVPGQYGGQMPGPTGGPSPPRPSQFPPAGSAQQNPNQMINQMGQMSLSGGPSGPIYPPSSMGGPPLGGNTGLRMPNSSTPPTTMLPPTSQMPPTSYGQPSSMGATQTSMGMPQQTYNSPNSMGGPPPSMGGPPTSMGPPPTSMGPPPSNLGGPTNMGPRPSNMGPAQGSMGQPPTGMGQPRGMMPPPGNMGPPPTSMAQPPSSMVGPPPMMGQMPPMSQGGPLGQTSMHPPPPSPTSYPQAGMGGGFPGQPPPPGAGFSAPPSGGQMNPAAPSGPIAGQPQQARRLDPDQMPSPIQVIEDDKRNRSGVFQTGQRGIVPPLCTTDFLVEDQGNCSPRFMRSTMYNIPCTADMIKQCHLPIALSITPFARILDKETPPPLVDLGQLGPVRCNRCKAYMCPYMLFVDGGRRFQCCFCGCNTEVPPEYFAHLDHTGRRVDTYDRPELCLGAYEFIATEDYCKNNKLPKEPAFIFMIDVSYNSIKSGLVHLLCSRLKEDVLKNLPKETGADASEIRVGFVTYSKELHFYNVKGALAQPQMLVVSDVQDVFVPLLDGFLVTLEESEAVIDSLLSQIPTMFAESRETEVVLGPVIQAGLDALKSADRPGKLFIFHSSLPTAEAPGKLKNRDDRKLLGTEKEKTILTPQTNFYTKLGHECVTVGCGVDVFLFPNSYMDIATVAEVPRLTGGSLYKYTYFQADLDGLRFLDDLKQAVSKPIAFDAIMRVRTSTGIRPTDFLGNFYMSNTTDVEVAIMDCDQSVAVEVKHDDKLNEADGAYIQAAILYTSISGKRVLRVLNMSYNCCTQMADLFRNCELDTLVNFIAKQSIRSSLNSNPKQVRETIMTQCAQILACYRKNCASPSSAGQLILPECMKLLPVYCNCIIKSGILQGGSDISTDDRSYACHLVNSMSVKATNVYFYPRLLPLHEISPKSTKLPTPIRCSYERLKDTGVYLIENGFVLFMWVGYNVPMDWVQNVFGTQSAAQIDIDKTTLQDLDNELSRKVREVVRDVREERHRHLKLAIVRQRDKLEPVFQQYLVEDRGSAGTSYVDFLCHIHKEIRSLLN